MAVFTMIASAVATISSWTIGLGAFGTFAIGNFLLRAAVQLGVSALAKAFAKKSGPESEPFAIQGSVRTGGSVPRSFVMGPSLTAGSLVWHSEWGVAGDTPNAYYTQVVALSDLPVAGLKRWFIEGRAVSLEDTGDEKGLAAVEYREAGRDHAWIRFHDGNQTAADPFLTGTVNDGAPRAYAASRIGTGIAYAVVTFRVNQEIYTGFPRSKFVLDGVKLYDVSKDSSQGGTGAQRWDDPATWGGDGDALPAVQAYNLARGLSYGGQWFYGLQGLTAARLPAAHWIAQIEKCRDPITGEDGPEPLYRCAGEITVNSEIGSAFEAILTACAGRMSEVGGIFKVHVGASVAPITSFTDEDIVSLAPQTFTPFYGLSDTVNGVIASYPSPDEGYVMRSTPPLYNPAFEAEDGGRRLMTDVQLSFVPFPAQAQRLLAGELAAARRARRHTFTLPAKFRLIEPGDTVSWTSGRNGYAAKQFRVDGVIDLPNCDLIVDLTEVDPADHGNWNHATDYVPVEPLPLLPVRPTAQGVVGFNPVATDIQDGAGTARRPGLLMQWSTGVDDIAGLMFEVRVQATGAMVAAPETRAFDAGELTIEAGLVAATAYEVRAKYIPASPRPCNWTSWVAVSTNDVRFRPDDFGPDSIEWSALALAVRDQIDSSGDASASAALADAARIASEAARDGAQAEASQSDAARIASEAASADAQASAASAGGSASAAAGSASAAAASETAAGSSASAAESSRLAAETMARQTLPATFDQDGAFFSNGYYGGVDAPELGAPFSFVDVAGSGRVAQVVAPGGINLIIANRGYMSVSNGRTYRLRMEARQTAGSVDGKEIALQFRGYADTSFGIGADTGTLSFAIPALNQWFAFEHEVTVSDADTYPIRRGLFYANWGTESGDTFQFRICAFEDITESVAAEFSASAAASSASAAAASETAAGSSASAAESSRLAAETARGGAQSSASAAASSASAAAASKTAAGSSASAANSSRLAAETARSDAQVAETAAVAAADAAGDAAAGAQVSRDVAVAVSQQGAGLLRNQFTDDDGTWTAFAKGPEFVANEVYPTGKTMVWNVGAAQNAGATTYSYRPGWVRADGDQRVRVDIEFELVSGDLSGTGFRVDWENTQGQEFWRAKALPDMLSEPLAVGRVMVASAIFERPGNYTGTFSRFQLYLFTNYAGTPNGPLSAKHIKVHRVQVYPLAVTDANTHAAQSAIADLQGNALASLVFRAKAGGATGAVEIVAASNPAGASASKVKLTGDEIEFEGMAVFKDNLQSDNYAESAGVPTAGFRLGRDGTIKGKSVIATDIIADQSVTISRSASGLGNQSISWTTGAACEIVVMAFFDLYVSGAGSKTGYARIYRDASVVATQALTTIDQSPSVTTDNQFTTLVARLARGKGVPVTIHAKLEGSASTSRNVTLVVLERFK